ncbi:MAG: tandem-95 repeat protein, partial [Myxococcales bacterium]|nr:tandem-95 repeat protein [Myxococcales bacterium]
ARAVNRGAPERCGDSVDDDCDGITDEADCEYDNHAPTAVADAFTVAEDAPATTLDVLANDDSAPDPGETLAVVAVSRAPAHGVATVTGGALAYAPAPDFFGEDSFDYLVGDGVPGSVATGTVTVTVTPVDDPPTAVDDAFTVPEDAASVVLDVLANDSDAPDAGETLRVTGVGTSTKGSAVVLDAGQVRYAPLADYSGADSFTYTLSDGTPGDERSATVTITVLAVPDAPRVVATIPPAALTEDVPATIELPTPLFGDPDAGDTLTYSATFADGALLPLWLTFAPASGVFTANPTNANVGAYALRVTGTDSVGLSASAVFTVTVANVNDAPTLATPLPSFQVARGEPIARVLPRSTFADPDVGDTMTLTLTRAGGGALPLWLTFDPATGLLRGTPLTATVVDLVLTATDTAGASANAPFRVTVSDGNLPPSVGSAPTDRTAAEDAAFTYVLSETTFTDPGDTFTLSAALATGAALPAWLHFDAVTGAFSGTPRNGDVGAYAIVVTATDSAGGTAEAAFTLTVTNTNDAPTRAFDLAAQATTEGQVFAYTVPAGLFVDVDAGDTLTLSAGGAAGGPLPAWLTFDPAARLLLGTPQNADVGAAEVVFRATDVAGASATAPLTITVANRNDAPVAAGGPVALAATEDAAFSWVVPAGTFSDPDAGDAVTLSMRAAGGGALPAWLTFTPATRTLAGTPANGDVGTVALTLTATDGAGATATLAVTVAVANTNDAPTVAQALPPVSVPEGATSTFAVPAGTFADVDAGDAARLTLSARVSGGGALPAWLAFSGGVFVATPDDVDVGVSILEVVATDPAGATASASFTLTVTDTAEPPRATTALVTATVAEDALLSLDLGGSFSDPDAGDTLTVAVTRPGGAARPAWLGLAGAVLSGRPANADVGVLPLVATATDGAGAAAQLPVVVTVTNTNDAPTVVAAPGDRAVHVGEALAVGVAGVFADVDPGDTLTLAATRDDGSPLPVWLGYVAADRLLLGTPAPGDEGAVTVRLRATDAAGATATTTFLVTVAEATGGTVVVANPIADQVADEDAPFSVVVPADTFDGGGAALTLAFALIDDAPLPAWLTWDDGASTLSGTPGSGDVGVVYVRVTASAPDGSKASDIFRLEVRDAPDPPEVVGALADVTVAEGAPLAVVVDRAVFSDPDPGDVLTVDLTGEGGAALPAWLGYDAATGLLTGFPDDAEVGTWHLEALATDRGGATATAAFDVVVTPVAEAPVATGALSALDAAAATEDQPFTLVVPGGGFTDPDAGDVITLSATALGGGALPAWLAFAPATGTFSGTPGNGDVGAVAVSLVATDTTGKSARYVFSVTVANVNDAPVAHAGLLPDATRAVGARFDVVVPAGAFTDEDAGDALTLSAALDGGGPLPAWLAFDAATGVFTGTAPAAAAGDVALAVTATDGSGATATGVFTLTLTAVNRAPTLATPIPDQAATEDAAFAYAIPAGTFADADGDTLTVTVTRADGAALPGWLAATGGSLSGTPTNADVGPLALRARATDPSGLFVEDVFVVTVANTNDAPVAVGSVADATIAEATPVAIGLPASLFSDPDVGDALALTVVGQGGPRPGWLAFDAATGVLSGLPDDAQIGVHALRVVATDGSGATASIDFALTVTAVPEPPVATAALAALGDQTVAQGAAFAVSVPAGGFTDPDPGDTLTLSASRSDGAALPGWLGFDGSAFSGTPGNADVGLVVVRVTATDTTGRAASHVFAVTVTNVNDAPVLVSALADRAGVAGETVAFGVPAGAFADPDVGDALTWSAARDGGAALPGWLTFSADERLFVGHPGAGDAGAVAIAVTVTDGGGLTATDVFTLTITGSNAAPTVANALADQAATEDVAFSWAIPGDTFADADGDTLTLTARRADGGALPAWLAFDGATFTGTPANGDVGALAVTVRATDPSGAWVEDGAVITVANVNDAPRVVGVINDVDALAGETTVVVIPSGTFVDEDAGDTLTISVSGVAWAEVLADAVIVLEPGPGDVGLYTITVTATDGVGLTAETVFVAAVTSDNSAPTVANPLPDVRLRVDEVFAYEIPDDAFADADPRDYLRYDATLAGGGPLPAWLAFDAHDGELSGTPGAGDAGSVTLVVTATDLAGASVSDDMVIEVVADNTPPDAVDDAFTVAEDAGPTALDVLANDVDPDFADTLVVVDVTVDSGEGAASVAPGGGGVVFTPAKDASGETVLLYIVSDGEAADIATVTVTVTPVNDPPTAVDDQVSVAKDADFTVIDVLANDSSAPDTGETLSVLAVGTPDQGGAVVLVGGEVSYRPAAGFEGVETFTYTLSDGSALTATGTVRVTVGYDPRKRDGRAPYVTDHYPAADDVVSTNERPWLRFSEDVDDATLADGAVVEDDGGNPVAGVWTRYGGAYVFEPEAELAPGDYSVFVYDAVTDLNGNALSPEALFGFSTMSELPSPMRQGFPRTYTYVADTGALSTAAGAHAFWLVFNAQNEARLWHRGPTGGAEMIAKGIGVGGNIGFVREQAGGDIDVVWNAGDALYVTTLSGSDSATQLVLVGASPFGDNQFIGYLPTQDGGDVLVMLESRFSATGTNLGDALVSLTRADGFWQEPVDRVTGIQNSLRTVTVDTGASLFVTWLVTVNDVPTFRMVSWRGETWSAVDELAAADPTPYGWDFDADDSGARALVWTDGYGDPLTVVKAYDAGDGVWHLRTGSPHPGAVETELAFWSLGVAVADGGATAGFAYWYGDRARFTVDTGVADGAIAPVQRWEDTNASDSSDPTNGGGFLSGNMRHAKLASGQAVFVFPYWDSSSYQSYGARYAAVREDVAAGGAVDAASDLLPFNYEMNSANPTNPDDYVVLSDGVDGVLVVTNDGFAARRYGSGPFRAVSYPEALFGGSLSFIRPASSQLSYTGRDVGPDGLAVVYVQGGGVARVALVAAGQALSLSNGGAEVAWRTWGQSGNSEMLASAVSPGGDLALVERVEDQPFQNTDCDTSIQKPVVITTRDGASTLWGPPVVLEAEAGDLTGVNCTDFEYYVTNNAAAAFVADGRLAVARSVTPDSSGFNNNRRYQTIVDTRAGAALYESFSDAYSMTPGGTDDVYVLKVAGDFGVLLAGDGSEQDIEIWTGLAGDSPGTSQDQLYNALMLGGGAGGANEASVDVDAAGNAAAAGWDGTNPPRVGYYDGGSSTWSAVDLPPPTTNGIQPGWFQSFDGLTRITPAGRRVVVASEWADTQGGSDFFLAVHRYDVDAGEVVELGGGAVDIGLG